MDCSDDFIPGIMATGTMDDKMDSAYRKTLDVLPTELAS